MTLDKYIEEAISSGRNRTQIAMVDGISKITTLEEIKGILDSLGYEYEITNLRYSDSDRQIKIWNRKKEGVVFTVFFWKDKISRLNRGEIEKHFGVGVMEYRESDIKHLIDYLK